LSAYAAVIPTRSLHSNSTLKADISGEYEEMREAVVPEQAGLDVSVKDLYQNPVWRHKYSLLVLSRFLPRCQL
jgi:hypothetical protein